MINKNYSKEYRKKNRDKLNKYRREWRRNNIDNMLLKEKAYRYKNKKKFSEYQKARRKGKQGNKIRANDKKYRESSVRTFLSHKFSHLRKEKHRGNKKSKYKLAISLDFLLELYQNQKGKCAISHKYMTTKKNDLFGISVDRINSNIGYINTNVQLVCQGMNFAKNKYSNKAIKYFWKHNK